MREELRLKLGISEAELEDSCLRWNILELSIFGSVLCDEFRDDRDVNLLVKYGPAPGRRLADPIRMERKLTELLGRKVDLVSRRGVEAGGYRLLRKAIPESAEAIYESG